MADNQQEREKQVDALRAQRDQLFKEAGALLNRAAGVSMAIEVLYGNDPSKIKGWDAVDFAEMRARLG
jgi:hypothetical protein